MKRRPGYISGLLVPRQQIEEVVSAEERHKDDEDVRSSNDSAAV